MRGLQGIRYALGGFLLTILSLPFIRKMDLPGETKPSGRFIEHLIFEHDIAEVRFLLEQTKEFIESYSFQGLYVVNGGFDIKFLFDLVPLLLTLHDGLFQAIK